MPESRRNLKWLLAILLVAGTALLYAPSLRNGFVNYDDPDYVTRNPEVLRGLTWHGALWSFGIRNPAANWHPLTWMSHMADVSRYGTAPFGHHLTNLILHCLGVLLLFVFLERATGAAWRSAAVAGLFALHPLNVESVAWVAERKAVLCMVFLLLTLWSYVWYSRRPGVGRYLLMAMLFAFALMSKIMVVTLPFAMVLLDYWPLGRIQPTTNSRGDSSSDLGKSSTETFFAGLKRSLVEKIPLFAISAAAALITLRIHRNEGALTSTMPFVWRLKNAVFSYLMYLGKAVWPVNLAVFYPHPENSLRWWQVAGAAATLVTVSALVWRYRERRYLVVGWLWFLGSLFPMCGIVQSGRQGMADRYIYVSLLGLLFAVVWLLADLGARAEVRPSIVAFAFALVCSPYIYATYQQIGYWRDSYTLFGHALEVTKNNGIAENNFGTALMELGQPNLAAPHFATAARLIPDLASAHYNLAVVRQSQNQLEAAAREYRLALNTFSDPLERAQAHNNLGVVYLTVNNLSGALSELNEALALNPREQNSYIGRGLIEMKTFNLDAAITDFSRAAQIAPSPIANFHLGRALESKGDYEQAQKAYAAALRLYPAWAEARVRLDAVRRASSEPRQTSGSAE